MSEEPYKIIPPGERTMFSGITNASENPGKVYTSDDWDKAWDKAWIDWAYEMKALMMKKYKW